MTSAPTVCPICKTRSHRGRKVWDGRLFCCETCMVIAKLRGPVPYKTMDEILKQAYVPALRAQLAQRAPWKGPFNETV